ncbi:hypothetical protein A2960_02270 [Candidatus Gottesmanbacteria bacterium RIFCSPLOWO2_01_FULL_39_12b]|uniref:Sulfatase N-terminal domain-containing protein n=1 Tax=Candidatus Gottesmanbacteria bacterium RIFCSPLOWO2_01_FULL_39_12b TaxID=1798388 RepID=A0A1F6AQH8_9BACT|nr:MAG: hypothetical protein A2960_02270 [Candidatus Gottesmanbacteria bacterium RIFCSPLOWO2_01_FULL_39_12b]
MFSIKSLHKIIFAISFTALFVVWQWYFVKSVFNFDFLARPILADGFCKDCNVILISLDNLRAKSLLCYGYEKNTAPNLCSFAGKSYLFKNVYTPSSKTQDSHFSIFTGLYPISHGMTVPFTSVLDSNIKTLPQILASNGYTTLFSGPKNDPHLPLDRGFERGFSYKDKGDEPRYWMDNMKKNNLLNRKFFAFLHTYRVHEPYIPQKENINKFYPGGPLIYVTRNDLCKKAYIKLLSQYPDRFKNLKVLNDDYCNIYRDYNTKYAATWNVEIESYLARLDPYWDAFNNLDFLVKKEYTHALYATSIYEMDLELKKFFNELENNKLLDKTIVVITADHGEEFFEHGGHSHAANLYNESIQVPLIIYIPKSKSQIVEKLASSVDIMPTILSILGIEAPEKITGIDLFSSKENKFVLAQHVTANLETIITLKWKLILNGDEKELFDLTSDPEEQIDLSIKNTNISNDLENKLNNYLFRLPKYNSIKSEPFPTWIDEEQRKKLIETGYF